MQGSNKHRLEKLQKEIDGLGRKGLPNIIQINVLHINTRSSIQPTDQVFIQPTTDQLNNAVSDLDSPPRPATLVFAVFPDAPAEFLKETTHVQNNRVPGH